MAKKTASVHNIEDGQKSVKAAPKTAAIGPEPQFDESGRVRLPPLPRAGKKQKPQKECECGCGMLTRSRFVPGHDSYLRGWTLRVERGIVKISEVPEQHRDAVKKAMRVNKAAAADAQETQADATAE